MKGKKTGGRQKGSLNRTTAEIQTALLQLLDDNLENLQNDIDGMEGKDRATILLNLAKHVTPQATNPEKLTEDQLKQIVEYLTQQQNGIKKTT